MEPGADFQKSSNPTASTDGSNCRTGDLGKELQEGALSGAVFADDAYDISLINLEIDVTQCPYIVAVAGMGSTVIGLTDPKIGVLFL
jgi:hypothetical protein